ncbi:dephospho-CoA kinase [Olsenella massiliensis]|uniref:dephospho-CoA kinase n=1 Tax=Olsenella massiliensis TaxID=1622075 RepID=UPI00071E1BC3|nr:dephospho-CoA kinase [Olsenella massiliensis]
MYTVFLAGGIASGKSTVATELERLGAARLDLDRLSREALEPESSCLESVARAFGADIVDGRTGRLDRSLLARRAFVDERTARLLEELELPYVIALLRRDLSRLEETGSRVVVVEVPLLDRAMGLLPLADEVVCVTCPLDRRRARARGRGMDLADFERRRALQPSDEFLRAHADVVIENSGSLDELRADVRVWWKAHQDRAWAKERGHRG